jgi:hypothetical protein
MTVGKIRIISSDLEGKERVEPVIISCGVLADRIDGHVDLAQIYRSASRTNAEVQIVEVTHRSEIGRVLKLHECSLVFSVGEHAADKQEIAQEHIVVNPSGFSIDRTSNGRNGAEYFDSEIKRWGDRGAAAQQMIVNMEMIQGYNDTVAHRRELMTRALESYMKGPVPEFIRLDMLDVWYLWKAYGQDALKKVAESIWAEATRRSREQEGKSG